MQKVHPRIKAIIEAIYGGFNKKSIEKFIKEYKKTMSNTIDLENPNAGIYLFIRRKWGLSSDAITNLEKNLEHFKNKKFKTLKQTSYSFLLMNMITNFLNFLYSLGEISINKIDFIGKGNPEDDAKLFAKTYGFPEDEIISYEKLRNLLENKYDIYVFQLPLNTNHHEGIINPDTPSFIVLNANADKVRAGFLLAHEIGHLVFNPNNKSSKRRKSDKDEEDYANKFATHLIVPESIVGELKSIFVKSIQGESRFPFLFSREICLKYKCDLSPSTALMKLFYNGFISKEELEKYNQKLIKFIRAKGKHKNKVKWLQKLTESLGVYIPTKYKLAVERVYKKGLITENRKRELLLEGIINVHNRRRYHSVGKFSGMATGI